jgi:hypothetical protein
MRRQRKREETERRFLTRQQGLRERRQRKQNPSSGGLPAMTGDGPAASETRASLGRYGNASPTESRAEAAGTYSGGK